MATYTQDKRTGELKTPQLGSDVLVLKNFVGVEQMSELFEFHVEGLADKKETDDVDFTPQLSKHCTVIIDSANGEKRYFSGILTEVRRLGSEHSGVVFGLTLRPKVWLLTKVIRTRAFKALSVPDILKKVFEGHDVSYQIEGSFQALEYVVQHNESDLNFARRLMETNGISFHFEFADGKDTMKVTNTRNAYPTVAGGAGRRFDPASNRQHRDEEVIDEWLAERKIAIGKVTLRDYDFRTPNQTMEVEKSAPDTPEPSLESYGHPYFNHLGDKMSTGEGNKFAQIGVDAFQTEDFNFHAAGDCVTFAPGHVMELEDHNKAGEYLILRARHDFSSQSFRSGDGGGEGYSGSYVLMPNSRKYSPPIVTPRPVITGPQTAKVGGDDEIDVDELGRILVWFHWNRENGHGEEAGWAIRARVAQVWASEKWGGIFTPRKGMEVLVQFIDGDPDRPVVIGSVYNNNNKPPFDLPGKKNVAGWKSNSTTGGGGYNEFSMDDTKGSEVVTFQAQKDLKSTILNDETRDITNDRTTTITGKDTLTVTKEIMIESYKSITLKVGTQSIVLDQQGITIEGLMIKVDAKTMLNTKGGAMATHEAGGMMTIKGAITLIN